MDKPEWLEELPDGSAKITLGKPLDVDGTKFAALTMREPTAGDQLVAAEAKGSDALKEINLLANLCEVSPADIQKLTMRDYKRVQRAFMDFTD
ncbi:phage tail assembly protein [Sphingopyxis sp.]|uniref:phage tail assembly protein n=1 Tax=Sphingopyxis sp. TaxID=1908224 RepID=UPI0040368AFB